MNSFRIMTVLLFFTALAGCGQSESADASWPGGVIPYSFGSANEGQKALVLEAMSEWECGSSVRFVEVQDPSSDHVTISFLEAGAKNRATIGYHARASVHFSAGALRLTVLHELGHVIGLRHEHQRPDRDSYIRIDENICALTGWSADDIRVLGADDFLYDVSSFAYDYQSIMAYHSPYITDLNGAVVAAGRSLTETDIAKVNAIYGGKPNMEFGLVSGDIPEESSIAGYEE